jgi:phosphatidylglycerophosphate synthase
MTPAENFHRLEADLADAEGIIAQEAVELTDQAAAWWQRELDRMLEPLIGQYVRDDPSQYSWPVRNSANLITLGRGLLTLALFFPMRRVRSYRMRVLVAVLALIVIAFDLVDGGVARKLRITSVLGKALDPLMDKLFFVLISWATLEIFRGGDSKYYYRLLQLLFAIAAVLELDVAINGTHQGILAWRCDRLEPDNKAEITGATGNGKIKFLLQVAAVGVALFTPDLRKALIRFAALLGIATVFSRRSNHDHREEVVMLKTELQARKERKKSQIKTTLYGLPPAR